MECNKLLTQPTVLDLVVVRSHPSVFTSLVHKSRHTEYKKKINHCPE